MARIRTIKPEFFRHHDLYLAEMEDKLPLRVSFAGLWTVCDREGRFKWDSDSLKLDCLPYDKLDFSRVLDALLTRGFIEKYELNGRCYGWIPSFLTHQVINNREKPSQLPNPLESNILTRAPREGNACPTPLYLDQVEGKGREGNRKGREMRVGDASLDEVVAIWNSTSGITQIRKLDLERTKSLKSRLSDPDWQFKEALKKFPLNCFMDGGWIPDFDWFIKPGTVNKILEGKYDFIPKREGSNGNGKPKQIDILDKMLADAEAEENGERSSG